MRLNRPFCLALLLAALTPLTAQAWVAGRTVVGPNGGVAHTTVAGRPLPPPPPPVIAPTPYYHPVATAAVATAAVVTTAAVVGSIVHSIPPSCSAVMVNGVTFQQCGNTWYQPQYSGTTVQYVVVNPPH
ncbi:hypothetical protein [Silvimonas iriomotensis]|uniref:Uncharacterized protein n=1 Tax=Silvimonas iriomotensis TaxID=449662 RepID=A0ABQ2P494_9NEIS|nr:hypothetical protein [Silvimonas iriomotensis]GGP17817.1 hypothetical protein GCM10010970_01700 [Silvimonas iriomotensis]